MPTKDSAEATTKQLEARAKVTALALSADCTAGTTGIPLIDHITQNVRR
jgi:hypothetical protein